MAPAKRKKTSPVPARKAPQKAPTLNQPGVFVSLPAAAVPAAGQLPLLLQLAGHAAGVVFATAAEHGKGLECRFRWVDVVNPSVLPQLPAAKAVPVSLVALGKAARQYPLGSLRASELAGFLQVPLKAAPEILLATRKQREAGVLPASSAVTTSDVTLVAFYLPQFHPIAENDVWWGAGFTEWTMVARARPCFKNHQQPRLPGELGFYDLRVPEVLAAQARLAREYGIGAFCFYYYWFGGRRLLEKPMELLLANPAIDMPFCICWANEPWTRRWDGQEKDVLLDQPHTPESDARFILDVIPVLQDPRYLRVKGKPLLLVYRAALLALPLQTTELWRQLCRDNGLGEIELAAVEAFGFEGPADYGFDSSVEFPPHGAAAPHTTPKPCKGAEPFTGVAVDYPEVAALSLARQYPWRRYRGLVPGWDNTPRMGAKGSVMRKANPRRYALWLDALLADTRSRLGEGERLVFINAWNEWSEGAVLEPDQQHGRAYLEATRAALLGELGWQTRLQQLGMGSGDATQRAAAVAELHEQFEAAQRTLNYLQERVRAAEAAQLGMVNRAQVTDSWPQGLAAGMQTGKATGAITVVGAPGRAARKPLYRLQALKVQGWLLDKTQVPQFPVPVHVMLQNEVTKKAWFGSLYARTAHVQGQAVATEATRFAGFAGSLDCAKVPAGRYRLALLQQVNGNWCIAELQTVIELV